MGGSRSICVGAALAAGQDDTDMSTSQDTKGQEILRMADEIRVRLHLAGMEVKDAWAKIEPKVTAFEVKLAKMVGHASDDFDTFAIELFRELKHLKARVVD
jgi:hypothetical protein